MTKENLDANNFNRELIELRSLFHNNPEIGFSEYWTTARICEYLSKLECDVIFGDKLFEGYTNTELLNNWNNDKFTDAIDNYKNDIWISKLNGKTGAVAIIKGKSPGENIGFRVDIDGLNIEESIDVSHKTYKNNFISTNKRMHA